LTTDAGFVYFDKFMLL